MFIFLAIYNTTSSSVFNLMFQMFINNIDVLPIIEPNQDAFVLHLHVSGISILDKQTVITDS